MLDLAIYFAYFLIGVALVSCVLLPIIQALKSPKDLMKSLLGVGAILVLFVVAYLASGSDVSLVAKTGGVSESGSRLIGAGLILFYITLAFGILGIVVSEVNKAFK